MKTLQVVILKVPEAERLKKGRAQFLYLRQFARRAVRISAVESGLPIGELDKSSKNVPLPSGGTYWSLSHKPEYVAGVAWSAPVGVDVEKIRSCSPGLYRKTATSEEWSLIDPQMGLRDDLKFFRYWTAKEAVLKTVGQGISGLSQCRVAEILGDHRIRLHCRGHLWEVTQTFFDGHIAAVVTSGHPVNWLFPERAEDPTV